MAISHFENGRKKAIKEIARIMNAPGKLVEKYKGYGIRDYGGGNFSVWTNDGEGFAETTKSSVQEAKQWIDSHPHPKFHPGTRQSEGY